MTRNCQKKNNFLSLTGKCSVVVDDGNFVVVVVVVFVVFSKKNLNFDCRKKRKCVENELNTKKKV